MVVISYLSAAPVDIATSSSTGALAMLHTPNNMPAAHTVSTRNNKNLGMEEMEIGDVVGYGRGWDYSMEL